MNLGEFKPIDFEGFTPTELRMPGIREYLHDTLGKLIEPLGFKFKKSNFSFTRKKGKSYEEIMFLFYNYHPLNYSFEFMLTIFNDEIEKIKLSLPPQKHHSSFNYYSVIITAKDFTNFINPNSFGYHYTVTTLDDLIAVGNAIHKTLIEETLPLADQLVTIQGIDKFFTDKPFEWAVSNGSMNDICTELIAAKLNNKRDYHKVFNDLCINIKTSQNPDLQTLKVVENLYDYLLTLQG